MNNSIKYYVSSITIILCLALLPACSRKVVAPAIVEKTIIKDSIVEIVRDSLITIPADSSWLKAYLECDSIGNVHIRQLLEYKAGEKMKPPTITIKENILTALSSADSLNIYLTLKDRYQYTVTDNIKYEKEIIEVNRLTKMQGFWIILGYILGIVLFLTVGIFAFKLYTKIRK